MSFVRGDVHDLPALRGARGHEQQGRRYVVILQSDDLPLSTMVVAPTSTNARASTFRPEIDVLGLRTLVLVEQATTVDAGRLGRWVGRLSHRELVDVETALRLVLALD